MRYPRTSFLIEIYGIGTWEFCGPVTAGKETHAVFYDDYRLYS
jgi:hypothetical protein